MIMLTLADLVRIAGRVVGPDVAVRDFGLLDWAVARPRATVFGEEPPASTRKPLPCCSRSCRTTPWSTETSD